MTGKGHFLFVTWEGGGNVPPVLGLAKALVGRGHTVTVLAEPCLETRIRDVGCRFLPFTDHLTRTSRDEVLLADWKAASAPGALRETIKCLMFGPSQTIAHQTRVALTATKADVLVADWLLPAALVAGEAAKTPTVALVHCINMLPMPGKPTAGMMPAKGRMGRLRDQLLSRLMHHLADGFLPNLNQARKDHGLKPLVRSMHQFNEATRILVQSSEAFDILPSPMPENLRYIGPHLSELDGALEDIDPKWVSRDQGQPFLLASLSTTFQNQAETLRAVISGIDRARTATGVRPRAILTVGPSMDPDSFDAPDTITILQSAPHSRILPHVDAFVTHCGHGSVMKALSFGVPMVAVPMGRDQDDTAARIVARGLGVKTKARPRNIAKAIANVIDTPGYRQAADAISNRIQADAASSKGIDELEALLSHVGSAA